MMFKPSEITKALKQSAIRAASARCLKQGGYNLGQGLSELPVPDLIKQAACEAIDNGLNQYSACEGYFPLREKIAEKLESYNSMRVDPSTQVVVTNGATGAYVVAMATLLNAGDEVIVFEPSYGYHIGIAKLFKATVKSVKINLTDFSFDLKQLEKAITAKTKAIVICNPANPCGKVYSKAELVAIAEIAKAKGVYLIMDEIYEYILYPGFSHFSLASLAEFQDITITISGFSKTYSMTGWRLGYVVGPAEIAEKMALASDLFYVCPPTPLQHAVVKAFELPTSYYEVMCKTYLKNRDLAVTGFEEAGFTCYKPQGAYYLIVDITGTQFKDSEQVFHTFLDEANVAIVPGTAFYLNPDEGKNLFRVCFGIQEEKLKSALTNIKTLCVKER